MKLSFHIPSHDGGRSNSVTAIFQQMSHKSRKKSAMSMVETHEEYDIYDMVAAGPPRRQKRSTVADFFRNLGNGKMSNRARYRATRVVSGQLFKYFLLPG